MITLYGKVEGGVFEPYAALTDDPALIGQEITMDWIDYDDDAEEAAIHRQEKLVLVPAKEETK